MASRIFEEKTRILVRGEVDSGSMDEIEKETEKFLDLFERKFGFGALREFKVEIREMHSSGGRKEYEIKISVITDLRNFSVKKVGWNLSIDYKHALEAVKNQFEEFNE